MRKTHVRDDGTKLATSSARRFVTFTISDDCRVSVYKRTDNFGTASLNHHAAKARGYAEVVTVDFATPIGGPATRERFATEIGGRLERL